MFHEIYITHIYLLSSLSFFIVVTRTWDDFCDIYIPDQDACGMHSVLGVGVDIGVGVVVASSVAAH